MLTLILMHGLQSPHGLFTLHKVLLLQQQLIGAQLCYRIAAAAAAGLWLGHRAGAVLLLGCGAAVFLGHSVVAVAPMHHTALGLCIALRPARGKEQGHGFFFDGVGHDGT